MKPIPVNDFTLAENEKAYVRECIESGWISGEGPFIEKFETNFAKYLGREYGIAVTNGSAALDIAIQALGIGSGDEVIMPTFTIISPALSLVRVGAVPVLVDSFPDTWNMNVEEIEKKINPRTKAILVVHIYGLPVDMTPVIELARKYSLDIIEDAAEMHGQTYFGQRCGSFGTISTFSFYANKVITTGEGGMILCNDAELANRCRRLRNLAFEPNGPRFIHHEVGYNYRMTNIQAAIGCGQLERIEALVAKKREIGAYYSEHLSFLSQYGYQLPVVSTAYAESLFWVFGMVAPTESEKEHIVGFLNQNKIGTRPFFWCMHEQPVFLKQGLFANESYPRAQTLARNGFYIPSGLSLELADLERVVSVFHKHYGK